MTIDIHDGHEHDDSYSVSPAAMSDEQIARRDAMSIVQQAEQAAATSVTLNVYLERLCKSLVALETERDEIRAALRDIVENEDSTESNGVIVAKRIRLIERAEKLLEVRS